MFAADALYARAYGMRRAVNAVLQRVSKLCLTFILPCLCFALRSKLFRRTMHVTPGKYSTLPNSAAAAGGPGVPAAARVESSSAKTSPERASSAAQAGASGRQPHAMTTSVSVGPSALQSAGPAVISQPPVLEKSSMNTPLLAAEAASTSGTNTANTSARSSPSHAIRGDKSRLVGSLQGDKPLDGETGPSNSADTSPTLSARTSETPVTAASGGSGSEKGKPRSLRFTWNMKLTSTRHADEIIAEMKRILEANACEYQQRDNYTLICSAHDGAQLPAAETSAPSASLQWKVEICRLPRISMHGVRLKRLNGTEKAFKAITQKLTSEFKLK